MSQNLPMHMQACKGAVVPADPGPGVWVREQLGDPFLTSFMYLRHLDEASFLRGVRTRVTQARLIGHKT